MITLYHRSGVNECLIPKAADDDSQGPVLLEAGKALTGAGLAAEAAFLSNAAEWIRLHEATNHYGDKFLALRATVPTEGYETLRRALDGDPQGGGLPCRFDRIAEVITDTLRASESWNLWSTYVRFIVCESTSAKHNTVVLYHGSGDNRCLIPKAADDAVLGPVLLEAGNALITQGQANEAAFLSNAAEGIRLHEATNRYGDQFLALRAAVPAARYETLRRTLDSDESDGDFQFRFDRIADVISDILRASESWNLWSTNVRFIVCEPAPTKPPEHPDDSGVATVANQALHSYADSPKHVYDGLYFRSRTETRIYDALKQRGALFFPLPVAVLGNDERKLEPDFVVIYKQKVGILEVHGAPYHPPQRAAAEAERGRRFKLLGVSVHEFFDADKCWEDPQGVVDDFLKLF